MKLPENITQAQSDENVKAARYKLAMARSRLLFAHPFFGQIAMQLPLVARRGKCSTAATDGRSFFFNPEFVMNLDDKELVFLVIHELGHCIYQHMIRRSNRDPKLYNIACDYVINNMIENDVINVSSCHAGKAGSTYCRIVTFIKPYLDHKYDGMSSEQVYELLKKEQDAGGKPEDKGELLDWHPDMNGDDQSDSDGEDDGETDARGQVIGVMSNDDRDDLTQEIRAHIISAASAGGAPADIQRLIADLIEPTIDWTDIISATIESKYTADYSFMRTSRKGAHLQAILPGQVPEEAINVFLAIDTSGSVSEDMLREFLSEISGMMAQYNNYIIRICQFDTSVYGYAEYTQDSGEDIADYPLRGGGGTKFMVIWDYMKKHSIEPDQLIVFTDGMPNPSTAWGDPDYCDTTFLIHTQYGRAVAPYGESVYYNGGNA
jgi:predicted metal-dependent peptidase